MNLISSIALLCLCTLTQPVLGVSVMINEYGNGNGTVAAGTKMSRNEYIEFVIVEKTSSSALAAMTFGDSNDATSMLQGVFSFDKATLDTALAGSSLTEFLPGTIIVVKGVDLGAQDLSYNPLANTADGWNIQLVAGQGAKDHSETLINGNIQIGNAGDVVWISSSNPPSRNSDTSGFIHAIGHDSSPGLVANNVAAAFGSENILRSTVGTGRAIANMGGTTESLTATTTATMGTANGGANSTWIGNTQLASLASIPEPQRILLLMTGLIAAGFRRTRSSRSRCHE